MSIVHLTDPNNVNKENLYIADISCNTLSATNINSNNTLFDNIVCNNFELTSATVSGYVLTSDASGVGTWQASQGNVFGPVSSTDTALVRFNGTTGQLLENSTALLDNSGNLSTHAISVSGFTLSTSPTSGYVIVSDASGNGSWGPTIPAPTVLNLQVQGPWASPISTTWQFQVNGKQVTMSGQAVSGTSVNSANITISGTLPSNLRPSTGNSQNLPIIVTNSSTDVYGRMTITSPGNVTINSAPGGSAFSIGGTAGYQGFSLTYYIG
jgi:hypothetical protein